MSAAGTPRMLTERYRLERPLGEGGMATVFVATDLKHGRLVAVKMLRESLSSALGPERFLREIALTAQLDHPHIVPLLDSGDADGELFYVMPFVEGETLRDRLARERQLPVDAALTIADEVLDALAYAHARGMIHRDIKPENILLAGGHARVADFGIARAVDHSGGDRLTGTGISVGTPAYMSPEQGAAEREVDARSDLYAVGCLLFEMLAGQPPFTGPTVESVVHQHLVAPPRPITQLRPTVPEGVAKAIGRALAKAPADRWESAERFARALTEGTPAVARRVRPRLIIAASLVAVAVIGGLVWARRPAAAPERPLVAVLPFQNLGAPDDAYFADGVTEEITARLARISGIRIISRTTAMRYRGTTRSLKEIARELGVQYVLEGTIRTERLADGSGQVRVTPDLVRAADDTHLWTDAYTAGLAPGEIFAVQARIAERVAEAFHVSLLSPEIAAVRRRETADSGAYRAAQLGRFQLAKGTPDAVREAIEHFERAVALDPRYARPWAGLAGAYLSVPYFPDSWLTQSESFARAERAARRAVEVDDQSAEAHAALGDVFAQGYWRWSDAEREMRRALTLDPDLAYAHAGLSSLLAARGRDEEALAEAMRALALEPTEAGLHLQVTEVLGALGRTAEARAEANEAIRLEPENTFPHVSLAELAAAQGDLRTMAEELDELKSLPRLSATMLAWADKRGPREDVVREIAAIRSPNPALDEARKGWLFANVGETDRALTAIEKAVELRAPSARSVVRFPSVRKALGAEPRYQALVARMGLR